MILILIPTVIIVYRKVHTESCKKWLERLQVEQVPILVCLTFADKLYAEHMSNEGKDPDKIFMKHEVDHQLKVSLCMLISFLLNFACMLFFSN